MVSKNNRPYVAHGCSHSSCLPMLLLKDDCGWLQTTASARPEQATAISQKALQNNSGWCLTVPGTEGNPCKEIPAKVCTVNKLSLSFPPGASPQSLNLGTGLCQSGWTQGGLELKSFLRLLLLLQQRHNSVKRPKSWVSEFLQWLKVERVWNQNNFFPRKVTLGLMSPKPAFQSSDSK